MFAHKSNKNLLLQKKLPVNKLAFVELIVIQNNLLWTQTWKSQYCPHNLGQNIQQERVVDKIAKRFSA